MPPTRAALWRDAGVVRTPEGLEGCSTDPHPLARLIAACALARTESRGAHLRADHPERDPALDLRHALVAGDGRDLLADVALTHRSAARIIFIDK